MEESRSTGATAFTPCETIKRTNSNRLVLILIIAGVLVFVVVVTVVLAVVIPRQISTLEYYEYGLKREKDTGVVFLDKVYTRGRHWLGEDYDFLVFRTGAYHLNLENVTTFTRDKLQVMWNARMQFFLRKDELIDLYKKFKIEFPDLIEAAAIDELKSVAVGYGLRDVMHVGMEEELRMALRRKVGGRCCRPDCNETGYPLACFNNCIPRELCADYDKGLHVDIRHVQLWMVNIPEAVQARFQAAIILPERAIQERFLQEAMVIRKETDLKVQNIKNETQTMLETARKKGDAAIEDAKTEYVDVLERAVISQLQNSIKHFNISEEERTAGLVYLHTLIAQRQFRPNITFIREG